MKCLQKSTMKRSYANYAMGDRVGGGVFGEVFKATVLTSGAPVIFKCLRAGTATEDVVPEVAALSVCRRHPDVVQLLDVAQEGAGAKRLCLVFEPMEGNLRLLLEKTLGLRALADATPSWAIGFRSGPFAQPGLDPRRRQARKRFHEGFAGPRRPERVRGQVGRPRERDSGKAQ